jgi:D-alanyl-D-alanine dipeptidase
MLAAMLIAAAAPDLVDAGREIPGLVVEMRYAGEENFIGRRIDGYRKAKCLLSRQAADALKSAQEEAARFGLSLKVYDCYRPQRAVDHFVRWAADPKDVARRDAYYPNVPKAELFARGYIAEKSGHSRASTVDVTIDGLDMGGAYDFFDESSHPDSKAVDGEARANRLALRLLMIRHGFRPYDKEWWHFTLEGEPYPDAYFDAPVK